MKVQKLCSLKEKKNSFIIQLRIHKKVILFLSGKIISFHATESINKLKGGSVQKSIH